MEADRARVYAAPQSATRLTALVLGLLVLTTGCSPSSASAQIHTVRGVLLEVDSPSIQKLDSFTLRTNDGQELHFVPASNFNEGTAHAMTPGHMRQHMALAEPVEVTYREEGGRLVALTAADARAP